MLRPADPLSITEKLVIDIKAFNDTPVVPTGNNAIKFNTKDEVQCNHSRTTERTATEDHPI